MYFRNVFITNQFGIIFNGTALPRGKGSLFLPSKNRTVKRIFQVIF